ncbi:hypothetical protein [Bacillus velezensis]|nr:hypothetical protein [Bacillus velezensis]
MLTIKNVKDGGVAYIFGAEYAGVAALFPQFTAVIRSDESSGGYA